MTVTELRNTLTKFLHEYLEVPVILINPNQPLPGAPFLYYQFTNPYIPAPGANVYDFPEEKVREEHAEATLSFTACSWDRKTPEGYIFGEDEALALAERAQGFFLFVGKERLELSGITPREISGVQDRSGWDADTMVRRWGFDLRLGYLRRDARPLQTVQEILIEEGN